MSVHDETWNKCKFCKKTIKSWDGNKHDFGKCQQNEDVQLDYQRRTSEFTLPFEQCSRETQIERMKIIKRTYQPDVDEEAIEAILESQRIPINPDFEKGTLIIGNGVADSNVCLAVDDIIEIFESSGFTTNSPPDIELIRHLIVEAIQKRME